MHLERGLDVVARWLQELGVNIVGAYRAKAGVHAMTSLPGNSSIGITSSFLDFGGRGRINSEYRVTARMRVVALDAEIDISAPSGRELTE
jgi:hypothetical protein